MLIHRRRIPEPHRKSQIIRLSVFIEIARKSKDAQRRGRRSLPPPVGRVLPFFQRRNILEFLPDKIQLQAVQRRPRDLKSSRLHVQQLRRRDGRGRSFAVRLRRKALLPSPRHSPTRRAGSQPAAPKNAPFFSSFLIPFGPAAAGPARSRFFSQAYHPKAAFAIFFPLVFGLAGAMRLSTISAPPRRGTGQKAAGAHPTAPAALPAI